MSERRCRCGCTESVHRHYRDGSDCGHCGRERCPAFRPARYWCLVFRIDGGRVRHWHWPRGGIVRCPNAALIAPEPGTGDRK